MSTEAKATEQEEANAIWRKAEAIKQAETEAEEDDRIFFQKTRKPRNQPYYQFWDSLGNPKIDDNEEAKANASQQKAKAPEQGSSDAWDDGHPPPVETTPIPTQVREVPQKQRPPIPDHLRMPIPRKGVKCPNYRSENAAHEEYLAAYYEEHGHYPSFGGWYPDDDTRFDD